MSEKGESNASEENKLQINHVTMNANGYAAAAFAMERGSIQPQAIHGSYHGHQDATHSLLYNPTIHPQAIDKSYQCVERSRTLPIVYFTTLQLSELKIPAQKATPLESVAIW
jgi:hypothetical protein